MRSNEKENPVIDSVKSLVPWVLAMLLALALPLALHTEKTASAHAIGCGKVLKWVPPELRESTVNTWQCPYAQDENGEWRYRTCPRTAWNMPGYNKCESGESELCKCCRICKIKAAHVEVTCNATGCQPGNAVPPPVGTQVYYYPARLYFCTGDAAQCREKTPHEKCIEFELPDDSEDCGW